MLETGLTLQRFNEGFVASVELSVHRGEMALGFSHEGYLGEVLCVFESAPHMTPCVPTRGSCLVAQLDHFDEAWSRVLAALVTCLVVSGEHFPYMLGRFVRHVLRGVLEGRCENCRAEEEYARSGPKSA